MLVDFIFTVLVCWALLGAAYFVSVACWRAP